MPAPLWRCHESLCDHHQHCDHLADALVREILEIARLVDADNMILHILREAVVVIVIQYRGESTCAVVDSLCRGENLLCCRFQLSTAAPSSPAARAIRGSLPS